MENHGLLDIIAKCIRFVEVANYRSYDPFDALTSDLIDRISRKHYFIRRVIIQLNSKSPINLRRYLGIKKMAHTKTISDMLSVYVLLYLESGEKEYVRKAARMVDWLIGIRVRGIQGVGWGLNFPYATRFVNAESDTPNLYNTLMAGHSLLDYFEISADWNVRKLIIKIIEFIYHGLGMVDHNEKEAWLRYYPNLNVPAFNVNAFAASFFVRVNSIFKREIVNKDEIKKIIGFIVANQNDDGSWFYALSRKGRWIDGFHSGYILESLALIYSVTKEASILCSLEKGFRFYKRTLFTDQGMPKYFHNCVYPIEAQNCAQAIQTLARYSACMKLEDDGFLRRVIEEVLNALYDKHGYFYYRKYGKLTYKCVYFRWSQTPMILALLHALGYFKIRMDNSIEVPLHKTE